MSTQICPRCHQDAFTWYVDEDESPLTIWGCHACGYRAYEDESKERCCAACGSKSELYLLDNEQRYWYCCTCHRETTAS